MIDCSLGKAIGTMLLFLPQKLEMDMKESACTSMGISPGEMKIHHVNIQTSIQTQKQ
jgi:chemotaxis protein CheY-P-specific phosphatase CheC